jgi:threonine synthase
MDIVVSSNFERLLFDCYERDGAAIAQLMDDFNKREVGISEKAFARARELFDSAAVDDEQTVALIGDVWERCEYLLDPHSAIGVQAARECRRDRTTPMVTLATAHPAKFPDAVMQAGYPTVPPLPHHMADLFEREERCTVLPNDIAAVHRFMVTNIKA